MKYKELRRIDIGNLRFLCKRNNWLTECIQLEREQLFDTVRDKDMNVDNFTKIATFIKAHSNTKYDIEDIMFELSKITFSYFYKTGKGVKDEDEENEEED